MIELKYIMFLFIAVTLANIGIHIYFKKQRKLLLASIASNDYFIAKEAKLKVAAKSTLSVGFSSLKADIIFTHDSIFILPYKLILKMNQSILQYSFSSNTLKEQGVSRHLIIQEIIFNRKYLKLSNKNIKTTLQKSKLALDITFTDDNFKASEIKKKFNYGS